MSSEGAIVLFLVLGIILWLWITWMIGKAIGKNVSHGAGMILGIIGILFGFTFLAGISCIVYSQKNRSGSTIGINVNPSSHSDDIFHANKQNSANFNDTKECPYCAETIKKNALVCRFCGRDI